MDRIHELLDEPLSTNTTASVEVGSSNDQNVHPYPVQINRREDYPKRDQLFFERLGTYANFPRDCPVNPEQLALAGFRYVYADMDHQGPDRDMVRCDYCHGRLQRWEATDDPMHEHARHYPNCEYLLPLTQTQKSPEWSEYDRRLSSFNTEYWNNSRNDSRPRPEQLAEAGFHFVGGLEQGRETAPDAQQERPVFRQDATKCFHCNTTLHSWEADDDVWVEHAKWSSKCGFLIAQRGLEFVRENTQRQNVPDISTEPHFEDFYGDVFQSESARRRRAQQRLQGPQIVAASIKTADLTRKAERLPDQDDDICQRFDDLMKTIQCKVCLSARSSILFLPCSHISVCPECARKLPEDKCPICRKPIEHQIDAYIS